MKQFSVHYTSQGGTQLCLCVCVSVCMASGIDTEANIRAMIQGSNFDTKYAPVRETD